MPKGRECLGEERVWMGVGAGGGGGMPTWQGGALAEGNFDLNPFKDLSGKERGPQTIPSPA